MKKFYTVFILSALSFAYANQTEPQPTSQANILQACENTPNLTNKQALSKFLREMFDAKTDNEQAEIWANYKNYRKTFPRILTAKDNNSGNIIKFFHDGEIFDWATIDEFPSKILIPKRKTILSTIPSSHQLRYRFDTDKDDELSDTEMFKLLIELHYILQKATTNEERELLIERYANAIIAQDFTSEFSINWGKNSTFRIEKDPKTGRWSAPDEAPIKRFVIGTHPSQTLFQEKLNDKKYATKAMKILSRINPFLRAEKIEELLKSDLGLEDVNSKQAMLASFVEYINEKSELVKIPIFKSDPLETTQMLSDFSKENMAHFTQEEIAEYKKYKAKE